MKKILYIILALYSQGLIACTDFCIKAQDGTLVNGRSMEFALPLASKFIVHPRGETIVSKAPGDKEGMRWVSKYGFVAISPLGLNAAVDGMNEAGFSFGALWFPGAQYPQAPSDDTQKTLAVEDIGFWLLSSFATVQEVKEAMKEVSIWGNAVEQLGGIPPMHVALHDAKGGNLVIEFINGKVIMQDNPNGVLTNYPSLDWHLTNVKNYINLKAMNAGPIDLSGSVLTSTGQGSGLLGIPGDWTPPSRFVRTTLFKHFAHPTANAKEAVNLSLHLLNTVDIPLGEVQEKAQQETSMELTQWIVVKDLSHRAIYFRSYNNQSIRAIYLQSLEFAPGAPSKSLAIEEGDGITDLTKNLQ